MIEHKCTERTNPEESHACWCEISRNHTAAQHKAWMRERGDRAEREPIA